MYARFRGRCTDANRRQQANTPAIAKPCEEEGERHSVDAYIRMLHLSHVDSSKQLDNQNPEIPLTFAAVPIALCGALLACLALQMHPTHPQRQYTSQLSLPQLPRRCRPRGRRRRARRFRRVGRTPTCRGRRRPGNGAGSRVDASALYRPSRHRTRSTKNIRPTRKWTLRPCGGFVELQPGGRDCMPICCQSVHAREIYYASPVLERDAAGYHTVSGSAGQQRPCPQFSHGPGPGMPHDA